MHSVNELIDREAIKELKAQYCRCVDTKQWGPLRELFISDARFEGFGSVPSGSRRDTFVSGVSSRLVGAVSVHHCHTPEITLLSEGCARAVWAMEDYVEWPTASDRPEGPAALGYRGFGFYEDEYVKTANSWKISFSRLARLRIDSLDPPRPPVFQGWTRPSLEWLDG